MAKASYLKRLGRRVYKATGYQNPMKKGVLSTSRITKQVPKMLSDISMLKGIINSEKKRIELTSTNQIVGQINGNSSGHFLADLTPNVQQGVGFNQKTGNSFKWVSSHLDFQFITQTAQNQPIKLKIEIVKVVGLPYTNVSDVLSKYIEPTSFIVGNSVYDIHSPRDPDYFKNFVVLKRKYVTIPVDQINNQIQFKRVSVGLKLKKHHVRTNNNDPTVSMGQVFMLITADSGNCNNATVGGFTGVITNAINTGVTFNSEWTHYFYDN